MAKITTLGVKGYRGIREVELDSLEAVNALIGRNNSGKSSILESVYLASAAFKDQDSLRRYDKLQCILDRRSPTRGLTWPTVKEPLWFKYEVENPIKVSLKMNGERYIEIELHEWHEHPFIKVKDEVRKEFGKEVALTESCDLYCSIERRFYISESRSESMYSMRQPPFPFKEIQDFFTSIVFLDEALARQLKVVEEGFWGKLMKERGDKLVAQLLRDGYDVDVEDLTYVPIGGVYMLAIKLPKTYVRADDLGDGARYSIALSVIAATSKNTALLLEEPENHQHPGGLFKTFDMLLGLVKKSNIQIFISTHSRELLRILEHVAQERGVGLGMFFLERSEDGLVETRRITSADAKVLERLGIDSRFLDVI